MSPRKRCRKKIVLTTFSDDSESDTENKFKNNYRLVYKKQSPPRIPPRSEPQLVPPIKSAIEDTELSDEDEIFPIKRYKKADSVGIPILETSKNSKENSLQKEKQKHVINKQANSIFITKTGLTTANNNNLMVPSENKQPEEMIFVSPGTRKTCHILQNVVFSPSGTQRQFLQKKLTTSTPGSPSLDFPGLSLDSRASSLSDIPRSNLLDCNISLSEDKIKELLRTPEQKISNKKFPTENVQSKVFDTKSESKNLEVTVTIENNAEDIEENSKDIELKKSSEQLTTEHTQFEDSDTETETRNIEVTVTIEKQSEDTIKQNKVKLPVIVKTPYILDEDKIESMCCNKVDKVPKGSSLKKLPLGKLPDVTDYESIEQFICDKEGVDKNRLLSNIPQSIPKSSNVIDYDRIESVHDSDKDYIPSNDDLSDSEVDYSSENCAGIDQKSSEDENEDSENETLGMGETLPDCQTNNDDENEWEDITESPLTFDEFVGESTLNVPPSAKSPEDIYSLFVTDEMINKMVSETNNYARNYVQTNQQNIKRKSRIRQWTDTDFQEMKTFMAVLMAMGLCKVPYINLYWSKNKLYRNEFISSAMTRDRFLLLLKCWHVSNVSNDDKTDKLHKIRDMFTKITENFQHVLKPGKHVVIDETMIPWRGRLAFRQYIKNKSHRYGVKLYKLCTPEGYTYQIEVYTGKKDQKREVDHSQNVVLRLMRNLTNEGRIVIVDNFYTSISLAEKLLSEKSFICGTLNIRRKHLPKLVTLSKIKKGQVIGKMNKKGVKVLKWVDKRQVLMLTTCKNHDDKLIDTGKRKRGTDEPVEKPGCVLMYNKTKKGIDYSDQMSSYYTTLKKGVKWWRKVVMELLFGTALVNAWIVYNSINDKIPKRQFVEKLIEAFSEKSLDPDTEPAPKTTQHLLEKADKKRNCVGCYEKLRASLTRREADRKVKKVITHCAQCQKQYCLTCFNKKH